MNWFHALVKGERGSAGPIVSEFGIMQVRNKTTHETVTGCKIIKVYITIC